MGPETVLIIYPRKRATAQSKLRVVLCLTTLPPKTKNKNKRPQNYRNTNPEITGHTLIDADARI